MKKLLVVMACFMMMASLGIGKINAASAKAFYGIWVTATKSSQEAKSQLKTVKRKGFKKAKIYITSNWSNLNSDKYYVISTNKYRSKASAKKALPNVKRYYKGAYVKYTGSYRSGLKYTKLPDGWYHGESYQIAEMGGSDMDFGEAVIKSFKLKKSGNQYYAVIKGSLDYTHTNDTLNSLKQYYKDATRTIPLSNKCVYIEDEEPTPHYLTRSQIAKQLPNIENRIQVKNHMIVKIIVSA